MGVFLFFFTRIYLSKWLKNHSFECTRSMVPLQAVRKENADFFCFDLAFPSRFVQSRHERRDADLALPNIRMQDGVQCIESIALIKNEAPSACRFTPIEHNESIPKNRGRFIDFEKENRTRVTTGAADLRFKDT